MIGIVKREVFQNITNALLNGARDSNTAVKYDCEEALVHMFDLTRDTSKRLEVEKALLIVYNNLTALSCYEPRQR